MSSDGWKTVSVSSVADIKLGGTPARSNSKYWGGSIKWATAKDVTSCSGRFIHSTEESITQKGLDNSAAKLLPENTVLITARGTVGALCMLSEPMSFNQTCYGLLAHDEVEPSFLYYALKASLLKINSLSYGTVFNTITMKSFDSLFIPLPPLSTQRRIADILSALDEKIELNRQMNATLEAIAQAIFKEWFVDVHFPGFTGEMVESELGPIPKGWRVGSILEIADLLSGGTPSTRVAEYWDGKIKWVSAKDVRNARGTFVLDTERKITELGVANSSTKILPSLTTIVTARGTVGSYCILAEPMAMNQTNYGLKAINNSIDYFVFFSLANLVNRLLQAAYGTIFDTVTTRTFQQSVIVIPPIELMWQFEQLVSPLMQKILANLRESTSLAVLRDTLLPKLMSGEIAV